MQKLKINIGNSYETNRILEILCQNHKNKAYHLINVAFTTVIWHIWRERNDRIFKSIELPVQVRLMLTTQDYKHLILQNVDFKSDNNEIELILSEFGIAIDPNSKLCPP